MALPPPYPSYQTPFCFLVMKGPEEAETWLESPSAREWARKQLPILYPPMFGSPERVRLKKLLHQCDQDLAEISVPNKHDPHLGGCRLSPVQVVTRNSITCNVFELKHRILTTLSPIRILPPEILSEIFQILAATAEQSEQFAFVPLSESVRMPPPVLLVCHRWRTIALSCRTLWRRIILKGSYPISNPQSLVTILRRLHKWIEFTSGASVEVVCTKYEYQDSVAAYCLPYLVRHMSPDQWLSFKFQGQRMQAWTVINHFLQPRCKCFPKLKELEIILDPHTQYLSWTIDENRSTVNYLLNFPSLKALTLGNGLGDKLLRMECPLLDRLTLGGSILSVRLLRHIQSFFPSLRCLELNGTSVSDLVQESNSEPVFLQQVQTVTWKRTIQLRFHLFAHFPNMHTLNLTLMSLNATSLRPFRVPSLRRLNLSIDGLTSAGEMGDILSCFPSLTRIDLLPPNDFSFSRIPRVNLVAAALCFEGDQSTPLCPKLQEMHMTECLVSKKVFLKLMLDRGERGEEKKQARSEYQTVHVTATECRGLPELREADYREVMVALGKNP